MIFKKNKHSGFGLVELIVAVGIFALIGGASTWFVIHGLRYNNIIWEQLSTQNEGRKAVKYFVDDLRKAEESSLGSYPVVKAGEYEVIFYANLDDEVDRERVRYWLEDNTFKKGVVKPSGNPLSYPTENESVVELAHSVVNAEKIAPIFLYYDENFTGTENALDQTVSVVDVRVVKIQLELEKDPTETPIPLHIEGLAQVRNLKTN